MKNSLRCVVNLKWKLKRTKINIKKYMNMGEDQIYQLSRKAIEPVVGIIAEKLFNVELEQTSDVEDRAYKIDLKTNDLSFNIQVKTVKAINNHYWYKLEKEIENNTYIAFSKAPLNDDIIDSLGLLYNKNAIKNYLLDNPTIYFVDTEYIKMLVDKGEVEYMKNYKEFWIKNSNNIENYYDSEYYKLTKAPYVIKYDIKADDLNILDITYHH